MKRIVIYAAAFDPIVTLVDCHMLDIYSIWVNRGHIFTSQGTIGHCKLSVKSELTPYNLPVLQDQIVEGFRQVQVLLGNFYFFLLQHIFRIRGRYNKYILTS